MKEHPEWFRKRPDGTIQYAENPPKKYQDIYPIDFESDDWEALWNELKSVIEFWCEQGVRIFRVDNPHTKAFPLLGMGHRRNQEALSRRAFSWRKRSRARKSCTASPNSALASPTPTFAWRNTKWELTQYFTELTQSEVREFFRPNLWPNTPDILHRVSPIRRPTGLHGAPGFGGDALGANYGIYGPAFELCENVAREPGSEEYLNSEKYEIKHWDLDRPDSLKDFIARVNRIRRENRALQSDRYLRFHPVDNDALICFSKQTEDLSNVIVTVVNLDPHHSQSGWVELSMKELGLDPQQPFQMHELLTNARYLWHGAKNYVQLDPASVPAQIFRVRHRLRREQDFDYFL